jgi:hypothetical protein
MQYAVEMASYGTTYMQSFMKVGTSVHEILRIYLSNLREYNVGINGERDVRSTSLRYDQVPRYTYQVS